MKNAVVLCAGASLSLAISTVASAAVVNSVITADNYYAVYNVSGGTIGYIGRNELGAGGAPGQYNWSQPEPYDFSTDEVLYIAAWSDDQTAQGLLAQLFLDGTALHSGDSRWEVFATNENRGNGSPAPTTAEMTAYVANATTNNLWEAPFVGGGNGIAPWGTIAGITNTAQWMWKNIPGDPDPLRGGSGAAEMLIFRVSVPAPGSAAILALGGLLVARRRR